MNSRGDINEEPIGVGHSYWISRITTKRGKRVLKIDSSYPNKVILAQAAMVDLTLIKKIPRDDWKFCREESRNNNQVWIEVLPTKENLKQIKACIEETCQRLTEQ